MNATGLVVEYNPFHNGHKYHVDKACEIDTDSVKIAVMSSNFVQRGEPAIIDKWTRAESALKNGIDIVAELPSYYSCQSAEIFAYGAIGILDMLKCYNVVFGSESGNLKNLLKIVYMEEDDAFKDKLKEFLDKGYSYPSSYAMALGKDIRNAPNDILGIQYIRAINKIKSKMIPMLIKREKVNYYDTRSNNGFASGTMLRKMMIELANRKDPLSADHDTITDTYEKSIQDNIPKNIQGVLEEKIESRKFATWEDYYPLLKYQILADPIGLVEIQDMEPGFENRLLDAAFHNDDFNGFFKAITSKRLTIGRTQRILTHILLKLTKNITDLAKSKIPYIRILGFNNKGKRYLNLLKKDDNYDKILTTYKNITKIIDEKEKTIFEYEMRAEEIYKIKNKYDDEKLIIMKETK